MFEHPNPVYLDILLVVSARTPHCLIIFGVGAGLEQVPGAGGGIAVHFNDRVHYHVYRKGQPLGSPDKEVVDSRPAVGSATDPAVPNRVLGEEAGNGLGVVIVVAVGAIARFEPLDLLNVLQDLKPAFQVLQAHRLPPKC